MSATLLDSTYDVLTAVGACLSIPLACGSSIYDCQILLPLQSQAVTVKALPDWWAATFISDLYPLVSDPRNANSSHSEPGFVRVKTIIGYIWGFLDFKLVILGPLCNLGQKFDLIWLKNLINCRYSQHELTHFRTTCTRPYDICFVKPASLCFLYVHFFLLCKIGTCCWRKSSLRRCIMHLGVY